MAGDGSPNKGKIAIAVASITAVATVVAALITTLGRPSTGGQAAPSPARTIAGGSSAAGSSGTPGAETAVPSSSTSELTPSTTESDYWLSDFNAAQIIRTNTWGDAETINGTAYPHTVVIQESVTVTDPIGGSWDLARQCSTLSFKAAGFIDKATDPGARLVFAVIADGRERWSREIAFGTVASVTNLDISNTLRLTLTTTNVGAVTQRAEGGFGNLVVRCRAEPPNPKS
jgi:NPCBM/NEW2 domain